MSKQEKHGKKGEARTFNILIDHFNVYKITPDKKGCDFGASLDNDIYPKYAEVFITLNDNSLLEKQVIQDIINKYPYYNFIFNLDNFQKGNHFEKFWILENQTEIVLKHIAKNVEVKSLLKETLLKQYAKELSTIYVKYFTD
jgi:hypothetical protein